MSLLSFTLTALVLTAEGYFLAQVILGKRDRVLGLLLGYPLGSLLNALIFFGVHAVGLPLKLFTIWPVHGVVLIALLFATMRTGILARGGAPLAASAGENACSPSGRHWKIVHVVCIGTLTIIALSSIVYATVLPSYYWDGFTHWAQRAQISLVAESFVTDGVIQPHYPVLIHSLHMVYMLLSGWNDWLVGPSTLLLSLSLFGSLFVLLRRFFGTSLALITLTLMTAIPLVLIHLRQGFADIHVAGYILVSALTLHHAVQSSDRKLLLLSAVLCAAAAWTKWEGVYFGVLPWMAISFLRFFVSSYKSTLSLEEVHESTNKRINIIHRWKSTVPIVVLLLLVIPWPVFVLLQGLPLSPHGGSLAFNIAVLPLMGTHLFLLGSFGVHWYAIVILVIILLVTKRSTLLHPIILWGLLATVLLLGTYLCTEETRGLIQGDNFSRAMVMPTMLMTMALCITVSHCYTKNLSHVTSS